MPLASMASPMGAPATAAADENADQCDQPEEGCMLDLRPPIGTQSRTTLTTDRTTIAAISKPKQL